ncbi:MAG: type II/IV secretion system protein [Pseudomonadales bacterium]|nr:type II/IV secretion system protein [Pseudomonadales bacterium]
MDLFLDRPGLLKSLFQQNFLVKEDFEKGLLAPRDARAKKHPLEEIASLCLPNAKVEGKKLDIETLTVWLASEHSEQEYHRIDSLKIDVSDVTSVMSLAFAQRHRILAVDVQPGFVVIASAEPTANSWEQDLAHVLRKPIKRVIANPSDIDRCTIEFYSLASSVSGAKKSDIGHTSQLGNLEQLLELGKTKTPEANDQHIVNIVDWLLNYAFDQRASDIHIEPRRDVGNLRLRIDGVLYTVYQFPQQVAAAITSRLKTLARLNLAEKRRPQDGRVKTRRPNGTEVELRVSTMPTAFGEKMVLRIFDPDVLLRTFQQLGLENADHRRWQSMIGQPNGIVLVTGPTGSGKTTTLYSSLKQLATSEVNVCTIEDPIEMVEESFNQMQVQHNIDLTFSTGVRALLRQDPDIIMIGEIRDLETAEMAIQAALTGHLVLTTKHTNDTPSAVSRLMELGVQPYLIKATVLGVMAQRLVRVLCPDCKEAVAPDASGWASLTRPRRIPMPEQVYKAVGCSECRDTGFLGREGIYEVMPFSANLRAKIQEGVDLSELAQQANKEGMQSLRLSGAQKVSAGITTIDEVLRVTPENQI